MIAPQLGSAHFGDTANEKRVFLLKLSGKCAVGINW
jgi:hypothetical protein